MQNGFRQNLVYSTIYQVITVISPLITSPYLARVLGAAGYGDYNYTLAFANFFFLFAMLGVNNYGNRVVASVRNDKAKLSKVFWEIYSLQLFLTIICILFYVCFCFIYPETSMRKLFILQGLVVVSAITDINWFAFGLEKFKFTTIRNTIIKFLTLIAIFLFVHTERDTWIYILIIESGTIGGLLVVWPLVFNETSFVRPRMKNIFKHLKPNLVLFIPVLASSIYQYTDKIMLGIFIDNTAVGFYSYAESVLNIPLGLITAICTVSMPRITNLLAQEKVDIAKDLFNKSFFFTSILEIALFWGIIAVSKRFVPLYLGKEYIETARLLIILSIVIIFSGMANVIRMMLLIPESKDMLYVISIISGAIANLVGNYILMPSYGATGACIATVFSYFFVLLVQIIGSRKMANYFKLLSSIFPFLLLGFLMYRFVLFIDKTLCVSQWLLVFLDIFSGAVFYLIGSVIIICIYSKKRRNNKNNI